MTLPKARPVAGSPRPRSVRHSLLPSWPSWLLLGWWILVLRIVQLPGISSGPAIEGSPIARSGVETGSLLRTILVLTFGAAGALLLPAAIKQLDQAGWRLLGLLGAYLSWSALSFTWTESPQLTIRRLVLALLLIVGAVGLGAGYYGRSEYGRSIFARDAIVAGLIAGGWTWISSFLEGGVDLLAGNWTLLSAAVGTTVGFPVLLAGLVSIYGRHTSAIASPFASRRTQAGFLAGALITIISLRKRALLAVSLLATGFLSFMFRRRRARWVMLVRAGTGLLVALALLALLGVDIIDTATPVVTRGQELDLESLTGRVPLWEELIPRANDRLWTGVGFGAFWTPDRMAEIQSVVRWPAVVAHNGYIDEVLATGLPGLVLFFGAWITATTVLLGRSRKGDGFALLAAVWLGSFLVLNLTATLTQDLFQFPFYSGLVLAFAAFTTGSSGYVSTETPEDSGP